MAEYFCLIQSLVSYIEARVQKDIDEQLLAREMSVSAAHIRDVFKSYTGRPLVRYITERRIAHAAFELAHTTRQAARIAEAYGFGTSDTFTRAFKRLTGMTPTEFRASNLPSGRTMLTAGVYGPELPVTQDDTAAALRRETQMNDKRIERNEDSCVLYGVQKVQYCYEEATPFPACLRSVLNYLGQDIDYCYLMAASGASFRLRWNPSCWDGGNVDIMRVFADPYEPVSRAFRAAGRAWKMLRRTEGTTRQECVDFIRREIDAGKPLIAFGIIGPPEACIISGYRDGGNTLLGWNFFQGNADFAGKTTIDESGYFISSSWWENPDTTGFIALADGEVEALSPREILETARWILETEDVAGQAGGQRAYRLFEEAMANDREFLPGTPLPLLFERLMCLNDALTMICEGRAYAGYYLKYRASCDSAAGRTESARIATEASELFMKEFNTGQKIWKIAGGNTDEKTARKLADPEVRKKMIPLIRQTARLDAQATALVRSYLDMTN